MNRPLLALVIGGAVVAGAAAQDGVAPADRAAALVKDLQSATKEVRRHAAGEVRLADRNLRKQALPTLIDLLMKEKDGQVRLAVLEAITALGPDAEPAVPALLHTLRTNYGGGSSEESHQDYRSALALAAIGQPAVAGLQGLLKERKENVRAEAIMALGRIGPDSAPAVADLIPLLGDKSDRIRREATTALGRIGSPAIGPLIAAGSNPDATVRAQVLASLRDLETADDRVNSIVLESAAAADPAVRVEAIRTLRRLHLPDAVLLPILRTNLGHADENVRLAGVDFLVERRSLLPSLALDLATLLLAADEGVARHAAFLLRTLGPDAAPLLIAALPRPGSRIDQIGAALAGIGRPVVPTLLQAIEATNPRVRRGAALALGQVRPLAPDTVPTLVVGLGDSDPAVRADFLAAISHLGARASAAVPAVRPLLQDGSAAIRLRVLNILAQAAPHDDRLLADLMPAITDADSRVQQRAIDLLRSLGPPGRQALAPVVGVLGSPDAGVRLAAVEFLESHGQGAIEAVSPLTVLLADPVPKVRTIAAQTLGKLGRAAQPAHGPLAALLDDKGAEVREVAALALGNLELEADVLKPDLARALRDEKLEVRRAAMKSIQRLGPAGAIFIPDLIALAGVKENVRSVDRLLRSFERTGPDPRSLPELAQLLERDQVAVRLLAIKFLGLAGPVARELLPALERIRDDPNAEVRQQAQAACDQIRHDATVTPEKPRTTN